MEKPIEKAKKILNTLKENELNRNTCLKAGICPECGEPLILILAKSIKEIVKKRFFYITYESTVTKYVDNDRVTCKNNHKLPDPSSHEYKKTINKEISKYYKDYWFFDDDF